jgi:hypothetical protein
MTLSESLHQLSSLIAQIKMGTENMLERREKDISIAEAY